MNVLSIQSSVALGHVGNSAAVFVLQRLGHEVWPIDTVVLSNHPAHGGARGRVTPAAEIEELVRGLGERGVLRGCAAILTGYLGAADQGPVVRAAVAAVRAANPDALWLLDPVIGDGHGAAGRVYVKPGIAEFLRDHAVPEADILTPNGFELGLLTGRSVDTAETALAAIDGLRTRGAGRRPLVVATGLELQGAPEASLTLLAVDDSGAWRVTVPRLDRAAHGAGDIFAAAFLGRHLHGANLPDALAGAAAAVQAVLARSDRNSADLALIAAQDALVTPPERFAPDRLR
ncbi:MAG TPA: pyridoxal kinase PdxY [Alphaproteobacteria bacterium]|nr:pyridoxal kinase PdxY [Alphaproteobacteria bacterium]